MLRLTVIELALRLLFQITRVVLVIVHSLRLMTRIESVETLVALREATRLVLIAVARRESTHLTMMLTHWARLPRVLVTLWIELWLVGRVLRGGPRPLQHRLPR